MGFGLMGKVAMISALLIFVVMTGSAALASASVANVNIYNYVGESIRLHCKSGDRDLGERTLANMQSFGWGFTDDFWGTTLYYCDFRWGARTQHVDVWYAKSGCQLCVWNVQQDGFRKHEEGSAAVTYVLPWK